MNPEAFTITAIIVGLLLEDDYTSDELNSIGNWLILVGQLVLTTAAQQQLINNRYQNNSGSRIKSDAHDHSIKNKPLAFSKAEDQIASFHLEGKISKMLHSLGIPSHIKGYQYIRESIMLINKNPYLSLVIKYP